MKKRENNTNLLATYSSDEVVDNYSHMRTWIGHKILSPDSIGDYDQKEKYPLCFKPEGKVSLQDVMELIRNRYEGTEYSPDETGRTDMRVIGTDTAVALALYMAKKKTERPPEGRMIGQAFRMKDQTSYHQ